MFPKDRRIFGGQKSANVAAWNEQCLVLIQLHRERTWSGLILSVKRRPPDFPDLDELLWVRRCVASDNAVMTRASFGQTRTYFVMLVAPETAA